MTSNEWFANSQGRDFPSKNTFVKHIRAKAGRVCFPQDSTRVVGCFFRVDPDSQSPRVSLLIDKLDSTPRLVFGLQYCTLEFGVEGKHDQGYEKIKQMRVSHPSWFDSFDHVSYIQITSASIPVQVGQPNLLTEDLEKKWEMLFEGVSTGANIIVLTPWKPSWSVIEDINAWLSLLQIKIHANLQSTGQCGSRQLAPAAFWYHYANLPKKNDEEEEEGETTDPWAIVPPYPWLRSANCKQYTTLAPIAPYYIDDHERRMRLINAMKVERKEQELLVTRIFNSDVIHTAVIREAERTTIHLHVQISHCNGVSFPVPQLAEKTEAKFEIVGEPFSEGKGFVVDVPTDAHVVVAVDKQRISNCVPEQKYSIKVIIKPNLRPVENQIRALNDASKDALVFGDKPGNHGNGFSLQRTVLAHGSELDPSHPDYFVLNVAQLSPLEPEIVQRRLEYIRTVRILDDKQQEGYDKSLTRMVAGLSLILGPPGTGKTHVAVAIIVTAASLGLKVILAAGSDKAVDNLATAVLKFLDRHPQLKRWCGLLVRARTPGHQISILRANHANESQPNKQVREQSNADRRLVRHQLPPLVLEYARNHQGLDPCRQLLALHREDQEAGLPRDLVKVLKRHYCSTVADVLGMEARIVATTLSNAASDYLLSFQPDFLVCDESRQCTEGDHMIVMTKPSVKAVVLLGDPEQSPPTIISENSENAEVEYIKRSLMERLQKAGYPCTMLLTNYRCHPHILELLNVQTYQGKLGASLTNSNPHAVGNVWDSFTRSHPDFRRANLAGQRRVFINCNNVAEQDPNSTSFVNFGQVDIALSLARALQQHTTAQGEVIRPSDIMLISPYKAHRRYLEEVARERNVEFDENITVDEAQGQEANIVIYMLVKPSENAERLGFVADRRRMNVALSRAKKVLIVIGNLTVWDKEHRAKMKKVPKAKLILGLLEDVLNKKHVLYWTAGRTFQLLQQPSLVSVVPVSATTVPGLGYDPNANKSRPIVNLNLPFQPTACNTGLATQGIEETAGEDDMAVLEGTSQVFLILHEALYNIPYSLFFDGPWIMFIVPTLHRLRHRPRRWSGAPAAQSPGRRSSRNPAGKVP
jgi:hypothetical protein